MKFGLFPATKIAGTTTTAYAFMNFEDLAAYGRYRDALMEDADARQNFAFAERTGWILWKSGRSFGKWNELRDQATIGGLTGNLCNPGVRTEENVQGKEKGCDFGYALAVDSCEGATGVDACTVTALDMTTAFAVPDPS
jgi:hypothetical protein